MFTELCQAYVKLLLHKSVNLRDQCNDNFYKQSNITEKKNIRLSLISIDLFSS